MGCVASKSVSVARELNMTPPKLNKIVSLESSLPNYWESKKNIKISKEDSDNIQNVAEELGV